MEFGGNNNRNDNKKNVNTRSIQLYNVKGQMPSTLALGFWNDFASLKISPALPAEKRTQSKVYDYETFVNAYLNAETATTLLEAINTKIIPAIESNTIASVSVLTGVNNLIMVASGYKGDDDMRPNITIFKGLNDKRIPEAFLSYEFNKKNVITDYNPETGEFSDSSNTIDSEFKLFINYLEATITALTHADVHSQRHVGKAFNDKLAEAVGMKSNQQSASNFNPNLFAGNSGKSNDTSSFMDNVSSENTDDMSSFMQ